MYSEDSTELVHTYDNHNDEPGPVCAKLSPFVSKVASHDFKHRKGHTIPSAPKKP